MGAHGLGSHAKVWKQFTIIPVKSQLTLLFPVILAGISAASLLDAKPSKAVLYIDIIQSNVNPNVTNISTTGKLNRTLLGAASPGNFSLFSAGNVSGPGLVTGGVDAVRFTFGSGPITASTFSMSGPRNLFTAANANILALATPAPFNNTPLVFRPNNTGTAAQNIQLANSYVSDSAINNFFSINRSLASLGITNVRTVYTVGSEQIIVRTVVPGPLPLVGAAAAFGYSRKLRNRIKKFTPAAA